MKWWCTSFVLAIDQQALSAFYSSQKQHFAGWHVILLGHIIHSVFDLTPYCCGEAASTIFIAYVLTRPGPPPLLSTTPHCEAC